MNYTTSDNDLKQGEDTIKVDISDGTDFNSSRPDGSEKVFDLQDFEQYRITENTEIKTPVPIITINGETISTEGNITTFSGASKSGKSACTGFLIAGAISIDGNFLDKLEGLEVAPNKASKAVIHIDTEQARHKHQHNHKSILKRTGITKCPDFFFLITYGN